MLKDISNVVKNNHLCNVFHFVELVNWLDKSFKKDIEKEKQDLLKGSYLDVDIRF